MAQHQIRKEGGAGITVTMSNGDFHRITLSEYKTAAPDHMAFVSDCLGLSINNPIVETADEWLYEMMEVYSPHN